MFEVGKKVICIKDHSDAAVKRGQIFRLLSIRENPCCGYICLDIGVKASDGGYSVCGICGDICSAFTHTYWIGSRLFAPYDDSLSDKTTEELLQELEECSHLQLQNI